MQSVTRLCLLALSVTVASTWCAATALAHPGVDGQDHTHPEYEAMIEAFMSGNTDDMEAKIRAVRRNMSDLSVQQRKDYAFVNQQWNHIRPDWWDATKHHSNNSFRATMWNKRFSANYMPSEQLGLQAPIAIDPKTRRLIVIVTWRPQMVDSPKPLNGWLARQHDLKQGSLAEVIIWHELGHNYVTLHLPAAQALDLFQNHLMLYQHVQEFYADMTALRHASPVSARTTLMFRLRELSRYNERAQHTRAAHAVGAILLTEWLTNPDKWPMVRFPGEAPEENVELETIKYCYTHLAPKWSLAEYVELRDCIDRWMRTGRKGDLVLKQKGRVKLDNGLEMMLIAPEDRDWQPRRDAWVSKKLAEIIKAGRADKVETEGGKTFYIHPDGTKTEQVKTTGYWDGIEIPW
jgi:hypothetical protein